MEGECLVYIATNKNCTVLYTGVTNDLVRRMWQHRNNVNLKSFTSRYRVYRLVWCERFPTAVDAIAAEKQIKGLSHQKKLEMINTQIRGGGTCVRIGMTDGRRLLASESERLRLAKPLCLHLGT